MEEAQSITKMPSCALSTPPLNFVLRFSPSYGDQVLHFKVLREKKGKYHLWEEKFNSINELVDFYRTTTIAKKRQVFLRDHGEAEEVRNHPASPHFFFDPVITVNSH